VTSIGANAFYGCNGLISVHISDLTAWCYISFWDYSSNPLYYAHHLYINDKEVTNLIIPNGVTSIGCYAFKSCNSLTSITIPKGMTSIGEGAFEGCSGLTSITIPNSVTSIGGNAFSSCSGLTSITIPNSVTSIGNGAFEGCSSLISVTIPNSVRSIGEWAFSWCNNLTSLKLPDNLQFIKKETFRDCNKLKSITIPSTVEVIYQEAFANCNSLESVTSQATTPPFAYDNSFSTYNIPLYVPETAVESYKTTNPWSKFAQFKTLNGTDVEVKKCEKPTVRYENGEINFSCETEGVQFISSITDSDIKDYNVARIPLNVTYTISVHATKAGYEDSDIATATLCWVDKEPSTEGITSIAQVRAKAIMIQNNGNVLTIQGADENMPISVYEINGALAGTGICRDGTATVNTNLRSGSMAIVKIGDKSVKIMMK